MGRKSVVILFILSVLIISCSSGGERGIYRAAERGDIDIIGNRAGVIRTIYCDIYIEHLDRELVKKITGTKIYRGTGKGFPLEPCFQFIISNTWDKPFIVEKIQISYDKKNYDPEFYDYVKDPDYIKKRYNVNLTAMWKNRRLLTDDELIESIDYENETVEYRSDFIAPGDKVLFFRFFRVIPQRKDVKVSVTIKYFDIKKIIDFDIGRFDYNETYELY